MCLNAVLLKTKEHSFAMLMHKIKQPLYLELANRLREGIVQQRWKPGDLLPSESELCREFSISRGTVVRAIDILMEEGLALRQQGVGTFVLRPALRRMPGFLYSFSETVLKQGRRPTHRIINYKTFSRKQAFQYGCNKEALFIHRVRLVDKVPCGIHRSLVPMSIAAQVPELYGPDSRFNNATFSLYDALTKAGFAIHSAEEALSVRLATEEEADLLETEMPVALMEVHRKSHDEQGVLLELNEAVYLSNYYSYVVNLVKKPHLT